MTSVSPVRLVTNHPAPSLVKQMGKVAAGQALRQIIKFEQIVEHVKRDRTGADPDEHRRPALVAPHVGDLMHDAERKGAVAAGD
jgi:hypothetical protein